jgi:hypothetical protein
VFNEKKDFYFFIGNPNISYGKLDEIALETCFVERIRVVSPLGFLSSVCHESVIGIASYNDLAAHLASENNLSVSRQAIWKKVKSPCEEFFKRVLALTITGKIGNDQIKAIKANNIYKRILVEDSTIVRLPIRLSPDFSGVANGQSKVCYAHTVCVRPAFRELCFVHR